MRLDPHRLTLWFALLATGTTYVALSPSYRQAAPAMAESPWIGLPDSGMDASGFHLRQLLESRMIDRADIDRTLDLARTCGNFTDSEHVRFRERYVARFTESAWDEGWEVAMDVDKDMIGFAVRSGDFLPPPPTGADTRQVITIRPVTRLRMPKAKVEPLRQAWNNPSLWHAPQTDIFCADGATMLLEACIQGRYALRSRRCAEASDRAADDFRTAFKTLLPAPEPAYERRAP